MVTGDREGISEYRVAHAPLTGLDKSAAIHLVYPTKASTHLKVMFVFAGHLAGFTARAARRIDEKSQLFIADCGELFILLTHT